MSHTASVYARPLLALALAAGLCGCRKPAPEAFAPPPAEVSVTSAVSERVERTSEFPGRVAPRREAQVRARAGGILLRRLFEEGANVREGQVLFEIDPAPLQAVLDAARATLARALASQQIARTTVDRYKDLVPIHAISQQVYDQAQAALGQGDADVLAAKAAVQTAELNLGYARVTAPISGRIGKAMVTEGALVSPTEATLLAVIRQLDPVYVDFTQSSADLLRLRRAFESGALQSAGAWRTAVQLLLEDGLPYLSPGSLLFSDIAVDPTTGSVTLRAEFPNPDGLLLPGAFLRARIVEGITTNAVTIPQRTVTRGAAGSSVVLVVGADNKVELRNIEVDRTIGPKAVVAKGLKAGERVIVEGSQKAPPGSVVAPVPYAAPASVQAGAKGN